MVSIVDVSELAGPPDPRSRLIARFDPLTTAERSRTRELDAAIRAQVGDRIRGRIWVDNSVFRLNAVMAGASPEAVQQLGDLQLRGDGYAVYLSPSR